MTSYGNEPKTKEILQQIEAMKLLVKFGGAFGLPIQDMKSQIEDIEQQGQSIIKNIDDFNSVVSPLGWANFGHLNSNIAQEAINYVKEGDNAKADQILINEINEKITWYKRRILNKNIEAFYIRKELILLGIKDHEEERYHASIPVLLACIDGIVNDIVPEQKGLFAEGEHTIVPNSITGYEGGLYQLISLLSKTRRKTNIEELTIPYRNGILHGHDINYYNKLTATKTLALLFAVYDWAKDKQEFEKENKKPKEEEKSLRETVKDFTEHQKNIKDHEKAIKQRSKRDEKILQNIIDNKIFYENTPEKFISDNFQALQGKKYGIVAQQLGSTLMGTTSINQYAGELRNKLKYIEFIDFTIILIKDESPAISEIEYIIIYRENHEKKTKQVKQRIIYENDEGNPLIRGTEGGKRKGIFRVDDWF